MLTAQPSTNLLAGQESDRNLTQVTEGLIASMADALGFDAGENAKPAAQQQFQFKFEPLGAKLMNNYRQSSVENVSNALGSMMYQMFGTTSVMPMLVTSLSPRMPWIRLAETQLLNVMQMDVGEPYVCDDWYYRATIRNQYQDRAPRVNPEDTLPNTNSNAVYTEFTNVMSFWGDFVVRPFVTSSIVRSQRNINLIAEDIESVTNSILRAKNYDYWNGVLQPSFAAGSVPQLRGLVNTITTNTTNLGGSVDLDEAKVEAILKKTGDQVGDKLRKFFFTNSVQVGKIRGLNRYNGADQISIATYNKPYIEAYARQGVIVDVVYETVVKPDLMVLHERDMPANTSGIICVEKQFQPREARFMLDDQFGVWGVVRQVTDLVDKMFVFDGGTLDAAGEKAHALLTGHN